jgi:hypothetical protein
MTIKKLSQKDNIDNHLTGKKEIMFRGAKVRIPLVIKGSIR